MKTLTLLCLLLAFWLNTAIGQVPVSGYAKADGVKTYYQIYGRGQPMLLINGGPGFSSEGFQSLAATLSERYQVILYDQRGTGKSIMDTVHTGNMTMALMAKDIEALRAHLGIKEWIVMGHSFGGVLGNYYIGHYPEAVSAFIASSSGGIDLGLLEYFDITEQMTAVQRDSFQYWSERIRRGDQSALATQKRRACIAAAYVYDDRHVPTITERLGQSNMAINSLIWQDLQRIEYDMSEEVSKFDQPVLIIQGEDDVIHRETAEHAHAVLPNSQLIFLPECGHYGWLDQPKQYFYSIHRFISSIKG